MFSFSVVSLPIDFVVSFGMMVVGGGGDIFGLIGFAVRWERE